MNCRPTAAALAASALLISCLHGMSERAGAQENVAAQAEEKAEHNALLMSAEAGSVNYRRYVKEAMQGHMAAFGLILTRRVPHSDHLKVHADALASLAVAHEALYPEGSTSSGTSSEIWTNPEEFAATLKKTTEAARRLKEANDRKNVHLTLNALVRLGESCERCHARFRIGSE